MRNHKDLQNSFKERLEQNDVLKLRLSTSALSLKTKSSRSYLTLRRRGTVTWTHLYCRTRSQIIRHARKACALYAVPGRTEMARV